MARIISWFVWAVLAVLALDSIPGFNANTLITTLGIGGIAIAFALQSVLADVASALTIAFDQPFEVGDGVVVDDLGGTIETIGLKSTRIRSWDGQEVICSNSDLLNSRINNYKNMERRRVMLNFGVVYDTSAAQLEQIPAMIQSMVSSVADTEFVWCYFTEVGASALQFQAMYWVNSTDMNVFLKARHAVHLAMVQQFEREGIAFAYPTQTVFLEHANEEQAIS
jgi:small-conductance mechanosensitive channel